MNKKYIGIAVLILIIAGGSFYAGMSYANGQRAAARAGFNGGQFGAGMRGARSGGFTAGAVIAKDATSITLKMQDGSTKIILLATSTPVMKAASGTPDDLLVGTNVLVSGPANADGSITAQSVQIRPAMPAPKQ